MLKASIELNRALEGLSKLSESLGKLDDPKVCEIGGEAKINAAVKMLKIYEVCVRIDEALADIVRHEGTEELERSLDRTKVLLNQLIEETNSFKNNERRMLLAYMTPEFKKSQEHLASHLGKRPAERIWTDDTIHKIAGDLSETVKALRKSAGYVLLMICTPDSPEFKEDLIC